MIMDLSFDNRIEALLLCAEIFEYPTKKAQDDFNSMFTPQFDCKFVEHDEIEAEYIRIFTRQSALLKCVPYASWWIDGRMLGATLSKIDNFYTSCGYEFDAKNMKKPADHVAFMIRFIAILAEKNRFEEIQEFANFLTWMDDFANSLDQATDIKIFKYAVSISLNIINSLKENQ